MSDKKEILIVDDDEANVIFFAQILEDHGYGFRIARNGKEALAKLGEHQPDLVLLDLMMPRKSGVHVFRSMKQDPALAKIPVIVVTGMAGATGVNLATGEESAKATYGDDVSRKVGAVLREQLQGLTPAGVLEKPVDPELLAKKLRELLGS